MSPCFAPNCKSGYNSKTTHCFRPDKSVADDWKRILSKIRSDAVFDKLNRNHRLCYLHFHSSQIVKEDSFTVQGEKVIIPRFRWKLVQNAIPTIFPELPSYRQITPTLKRKGRNVTTSAKVLKISPFSTFKNCELAKSWATEEILVNNTSTTAFINNDGIVKRTLHVYSDNSFESFCEIWGSKIMMTEQLPQISPSKLNEKTVMTILTHLKSTTFCQGVQGYEKIKTMKNCHIRNQSWYSDNCQKVGYFTVCTPYKLILPSLNRKLCRQRRTLKTQTSLLIKTKNRRFYMKSRMKKILRANTTMKMEIKRLSIKLKHINTEKITKTLSSNTSISTPFLQAVIHALKLAKLKSTKGMRYEMGWLLECLLLKIKSPSAYQHLRDSKILPLPHPRTIRKLICGQPCEFGFNAVALNSIQREMNSKDRRDRQGSLVFDEIQLRESLDFNKGKLQFDGFIDYAEYSEELLNGEDKTKIADHALVLMYRPLNASWVQPIAAFGTKGAAKGNALEKIVMSAVVKLENVGAEVISIVSDGAKTNKSFWKRLGVKGSGSNIVNKITHPCCSKRFLYFICDVPHILQCIRNHFKKYISVKFNGNTISYNYYEELFKEDAKRSGGLRKCPKLTQSHIAPNSFEKMTVSLATQLFSRSCATGLQFYREQGMPAFKDSESTQSFTKLLNDVFDALNGRIPSESLKLGNEKFNNLKKFLAILNVPPKRDSTSKKLIPHSTFASTETMSALRITISSILDITEYLIKDLKFDYVLPNKLTQDCLERFFGLLRAASGEEDHPTTCNFLQIFRILCYYNPTKRIIRGNVSNYEHNNVLVSFQDSLRGKAKQRRKDVVEKRTAIENLLLEKISQSVSHVGSEKSEADLNIIYHICGYVIHKAFKFVACKECLKSIHRTDLNTLPKESKLSRIMDFDKSLKYPTEHFFNLIRVSVEPALNSVLSQNELYGDILSRIINSMGGVSLNGIGCGENNHSYTLLIKLIPFYITTRLYFYSNQIRNSFGHGKATKNKRKLSKLQSK